MAEIAFQNIDTCYSRQDPKPSKFYTKETVRNGVLFSHEGF